MIWSDAILWSDAVIWSDRVNNDDPLYSPAGTGAMSCSDDLGSSPDVASPVPR